MPGAGRLVLWLSHSALLSDWLVLTSSCNPLRSVWILQQSCVLLFPFSRPSLQHKATAQNPSLGISDYSLLCHPRLCDRPLVPESAHPSPDTSIPFHLAVVSASWVIQKVRTKALKLCALVSRGKGIRQLSVACGVCWVFLKERAGR